MQVTEGNNNSSRPIEGAKAQAEWDAWKSRMGMSRD
jgi:acyl-CoA-binding protein